MLDLTKLGGSSASAPSITPSAPAGGLQLPTFTPPAQTQGGVIVQKGIFGDQVTGAGEGNMIWDQLGRAILGSDTQFQGRHGGLLGDIPVVSDVLRVPGKVLGEVTNLSPEGVGVGRVLELGKQALSGIPDPIQIIKAGQPSHIDMSKYSGTPADALRLVQDAKGEGIYHQFQALGQWQQQHDPEGYKAWQEALTKANTDTLHAADVLANYTRDWGTTYADLTPQGMSGIYDVMPELAMTESGSAGRLVADVLSNLSVLQRKAEKGAANLQGAKSNTEQGISAISGDVLGQAGNLIGGRATTGRIENLMNADPKTLTPVEAAALQGISDLGWTKEHALNFLIDHGQGYSHDAAAQVAIGFATDPLMAGSLGAALPEKIALRVAGYANTAEAATRMGRVYQGVARGIGTTVDAVRSSSLGPAFKVARTVIDPLHMLGAGPAWQARADVFAATGLKAAEQGFGKGAVVSALRRAADLGIGPVADSAFGVSAMNLARKWVAASHVSNLLSFGDIAARRVLSEDLIQALGHNAPKDAVGRMAGYVQRVRKFWTTSVEKGRVAEGMAQMGVDRSQALSAVEKMSADELAVWHQMVYTHAYSAFQEAISHTSPAEWGSLGKNLDNLVLLNPSQIDNVAATNLLTALGEAKGAARIGLWNDAAEKYSLIADLGRVETGASKAMAKRMASLERIISEGNLHSALDAGEVSKLPAQFRDEFINRFLDAEGNPLWRLGFKPVAEQASGLLYDVEGRLVARFEPNIANVTDAISRERGVLAPVVDTLGNLVPAGVKGVTQGLRDSLDVALSTATDAVSAERNIVGIEQKFRGLMRDAGFSDQIAKDAFAAARKGARETSSVSIAGLSPEEFWTAASPRIAGFVSKEVAKRDVFAMLMKASSGDMRLMGISSHLAQELRAGLTARGLNPENAVGKLTVQFYNMARYALNPMFFLQAVTDGPWFNMYRGIMPVGGSIAKEGTALFETQQIMQAMGHTGLFRDVAMDYTERFATAGWQANLSEGLMGLPGVREGLGQRLKNWTGRMILNNELAYINHGIGQEVFKAVEATRNQIEARIAQAATAEEKALLGAAMNDLTPMLDTMRQEASAALGRVASDEEVGRYYLSQMIEDSRLEVRTPQGLLDYVRVNSKGAYHVPGDIGELKPLDLPYLVDAIKWPNVKTVSDLRTAISASGPRSLGELQDSMKQLGMHPDAIGRASRALTFEWRPYFDDLAGSLGMSRFEMQGVEDMVAKAAKLVGMNPVDYITQVMPMTAKKGAAAMEGVSDELKFALNVMRVAKKGPLGIDEMTKLVTGHLQPSMKARLLQHFEDSLLGKGGLIEQAQAAGDAATMKTLNQIVEDLRGGWGKAADSQFKEMVLRRVSGVAEAATGAEPEVERAARYFSAFIQALDPQITAGEVLKGIVENIPVEGASPYDFTQGLLMDTLANNVRLLEKDAIRLANIGTERTVLDRSLNHPMFAMYPTSYMWGKVIPETFRFIAKEPFGIKTGAGLLAYNKMQQTVALQQENDPNMAALWDGLGKSAVVGLLSYITPSMPWEDMRGTLPPWVRSLQKNGLDISKMTQAELDTFSPDRWVNRFFNAAKEVSGALQPQAAPQGLPPVTQQGLQQIVGSSPTGSGPTAPEQNLGPTQATGLAPVLSDDLAQLQSILGR